MHTRNLPPLQPGEHIRYILSGLWKSAQVISKALTPWSYKSRTKLEISRQNRQQLLSTSEKHLDIALTGDEQTDEDASPQPQPLVASHQEARGTPKTTRSGRVIKAQTETKIITL
ncbi:hypothetical protein PoB_007433600 [Plakobranchus ocellatus]|uniref:Uncharacterized protein n=1 Tax=Plakobranchus ocellatus TaxID=259542 RepID=A0AAV4DV93_9GAST|nr:hypothetical protein PoB_007433600 [Plakobranchus ocellatus]